MTMSTYYKAIIKIELTINRLFGMKTNKAVADKFKRKYATWTDEKIQTELVFLTEEHEHVKWMATHQVQCLGTTTAGTRCTKKAMVGDDVCSLHKDQVAWPKMYEEHQMHYCKVRSPRGRMCKMPISMEEKVCGYHAEKGFDMEEEGPIESFTGAYRFLSNFWPAIVKMYGLMYPTVEHAYQAAKIPFEGGAEAREAIRKAPTPGQAKRAGNKAALRPDWEQFKVPAMLALVRRKFNEHEGLKIKLLATGNRELIEGNTWGDTFWGVCRGEGKNMLGQILMHVRDEIRAGHELPFE